MLSVCLPSWWRCILTRISTHLSFGNRIILSSKDEQSILRLSKKYHFSTSDTSSRWSFDRSLLSHLISQTTISWYHRVQPRANESSPIPARHTSATATRRLAICGVMQMTTDDISSLAGSTLWQRSLWEWSSHGCADGTKSRVKDRTTTSPIPRQSQTGSRNTMGETVRLSTHFFRMPNTKYQIPNEWISWSLKPEAWSKEYKNRDYFFALWRCIPYKKFDLLVETFNENKKPLIIATSTNTPLYRKLRKISKPNIRWIFGASNEDIAQLFRHAKAYLMPQEEDFGITPIEAMSHGCPVIAYRKWGATETVVGGGGQVYFFDETSSGFTPEGYWEIWVANIWLRSMSEANKKVFRRTIWKTALGICRL